MIDYSTIIDNNRGHLIQYRKAHQLAPWCFPSAFQAHPPRLLQGVCPIVTVGEDHATADLLFLVSAEQHEQITRQSHSQLPTYFAQQEQQPLFVKTIHVAEKWLYHHLPLWVANQNALFPEVYCAYTENPDNPPRYINGDSAGLSLILLAFSDFLKIALPSTLFCSATISPSGRLGPVQHLREKLTCIAHNCKLNSVQFVCAASQIDEARSLCLEMECSITVLGFATIEECLQHVALQTGHTILEELTSYLRRQPIEDFIDGTYYRALEGQTHIYGWAGLLRTVTFFKSQLPTSETSDHGRLTLARKLQVIELIASRYSNQIEALPRHPVEHADIQWLTTLPLSQRLPVLAHFLQQLNIVPDHFQPRAQTALLEESQRHLPNGEPDLIAPPYLKVWGAYGRLQFSLRRRCSEELHLPELFHLQLQCFRGWMDSGIYDQASYPLSEMLRLCQHSSDPQLHNTATKCVRSLSLSPNGLNEQNSAFVLFPDIKRRWSSRDTEWSNVTAEECVVALRHLLHSRIVVVPLFLRPKIYRWVTESGVCSHHTDLYQEATRWLAEQDD